MICEGFVKYLESLGSINQREVLIQHDQRILDELRETTDNARELMGVSPQTTHQLLIKACQASLSLRGRRPALDVLLAQLIELDAAGLPSSRDLEILERLQVIVATAG